jgi:hypothetical protein
MKNSVFKTKTKVLAVIFASMALVGCGGGNSESKVSAEQPVYWTEIAKQTGSMVTLTTYSDANGNIIVSRDSGYGTAVTQIINDKPMPSAVTKCKNFASDAKAEAQQ